MTEKRIQFNNIVRNQLPAYVREEFPLVEEFLSQYYISQEFQGAPVDLIQNIDTYVKLDNITNQVDSVFLLNDISSIDETIFINLEKSPTGTNGFPERYGLLKIDDEIITYTSKTFNSFTGCIRGFSGISSYISPNHPDQLVFSTSDSESHSSGVSIVNLSSLFLKEFLLKIKYQLTPGFENREFTGDLNQRLFIKQVKDFYSSKGTDESFKILFKALYGEEVSVIKPKEFLFRPSDAHYQITRDLVVESIEGNPEDLLNSTLFQNEYLDYTYAYAPIAKVEKITSREGKEYYKLSIDANYNKDVRVEGALYGAFKVHPQTKVIGNYQSTSSVIDVDSTVGFPNSGELSVSYADGSIGTISYTSKSLNQFFGCSNITSIIEDASYVGINTFAANFDQSIKVKVTSVLTDIDIVDDTYYLNSGYTSDIKTLGINSEDFISNNWFFNISPLYSVKSISLVDNSDKTYRVTTELNHIFKIGDTLGIKGSDNVEKNTVVVDVISDKSFNIKGQGELLLEDTYTAQKDILKVNSSTFPDTSIFTANVQNVYKDGDKTLVASSSLPYYANQSLDLSTRKIVFSGTFDSDTFKITSSTDHGFYTGDAVYYTPEKIITTQVDQDGNVTETSTVLSKLFDEGIYYVKRVNSTTIKLGLSQSDLYESKFISVSNPVTVNSNIISYYDFNQKTLKSQKLLREISAPVNDGGVYVTEPGPTGILINGVEILNFKSKDIVYYGPLTDIDVIAVGQGYDVINPPTLSITDSVGSGAVAHCAIRGSLQEIRVIDSGFDYQETPVIKITGGNGIGAKAYANMKLIDHQSTFNSEINSAQISLSNRTIGFTTYHKFRNAEQVIYVTDNQRGVGGLSTNSSYYVSTKSPTLLSLHVSLGDAVAGINSVQLTSYGLGNHALKSVNKKSVLKSVNIENSGSGYENKKRTVSTSGINTSINQINIVNHDFKTGEIVKYSTNGTVIGGLSNNTEYYITTIDENNFKLSQVGVGLTEKDFFFKTNQHINLTSVGVGTHVFNYPEISVEVIGNVGGVVELKASVQPIFRGEITSVHLESGGANYGSQEILNHNRQPSINLNRGSGAQVTPIITDGKIVEVLINSSGSNYNSPPNLVISGDGIGAVLTPIVENGSLVEVKVIESGIGYSSRNTTVSVVASGSLSKFSAKIKTWNVNLFQKYLHVISEDDGILTEGINEKYDLQYAHLYAPRKLREIIYSTDQDGNILYGRKDLRKVSNKEVSSTDHSPIIGWAYDGNPIYGPYGYASKQGGIVAQMKSGYRIDLKTNRPSLSIFPEGFFIEDYTYFNVSDETVLDENNGRFCVTPEFPNGTYAYFSAINDGSADSSGSFSGYKRPVFPYFIGNSFKSKPNEFNFRRSSNQDELDLNQTKWVRNTTPYNLNEDNGSYSYLELPNSLNQTLDIKYASPGSVEDVDIVSGGSNYKVGNNLIFDNQGTDGFNASAEVERISGKSVNSISVASTSISDVEFYSNGNQGVFLAFTKNPHNFINLDSVNLSGFNTTSSLIEGSYNIGVTTNTLALTVGVGSTSVTGIVTYFSVAGNLNYPNIRENDVLGIGTEKVKILNIDHLSSRIRVLRSVDGTVGAAHSATDILYEVPRKLTVNAGIKTQYISKINRELYFNPVDSVGLGATSGVGIGTTIVFSNPGAGSTQIFIPTQAIYLPNHQLNTGDQLVYSNNGGTSLGVSTNKLSSFTLPNQSVVYVAKLSNDLIGISTFRVGLSTQGTFVGLTSSTNTFGLLYFTSLGSGAYHSFKTSYDTLTGKISKNTVTVSTGQTHGLLNNDVVFVDVKPSIATTYVIEYNDYNKKLVINPQNFVSAGVNTTTHTITISNHGFKNGQKVIHTSNTPSIGLENNKEYYVYVVDENNIRLTNNYFDAINSKPSVVGINSASNGTLSSINPQIEVYRNSSVVFDLSDSSLSYIQQSNSYPAFDFRLFKDSNFTELYESDEEKSTFNVQKTGTIGITSDAKITLTVTDQTPRNLYYQLLPVYDGNVPDIKKSIKNDVDVITNNQINVEFSKYNGRHHIVVGSTTSFTYTVPVLPEKNSYVSSGSSITYDTESTNSFGPISKIRIKNKGQNYYTLPQVIDIDSDDGTGAIIQLSSRSIGKVKKTKLNNIGFNFPSDFTLRPSVALPQVLEVESLSSFESIGISSFGRGYISPPKLIVLDGKTGEIVPDVDLKFVLGNNKVEILKNSFALSSTTPTILPTQNSNGVGISSLSYNSSTKEVTVNLSVGFSTANSFPFAINDKVLVENVSVGVASTGKGFNSENYNYQLFTISAVNENLGGFGSVTYSLSGIIDDSEYPGTFDPLNSSGRIIPQKYFPIFDISLRKNNYFIGETAISNSNVGRIEDWEPKTNLLKVVSRNNFRAGQIIRGLSSNAQGIISKVNVFEAFLNVNATSRFENGWKSNAGVLNDNIQRVQDSEYYQNFSYSIKSKVDFDTWNDTVSTLNHTAGFKKFANYQLESSLGAENSNSLTVGLSTDTTSFEVINDIIGVANLNCVYDFDLVKENALLLGDRTFSDEIVFSNRILTDYAESIGNRVLSIDDISSRFNSNPRPTPYSDIDRFDLSGIRAQKYLTYARDKRFTGERQLLVVTTLIDDFGRTYLNQYGRVETTYDIGSYDLVIDGTEGVLRFYPVKSSINDFDITTLSYNIDTSISGLGSTNFGGVIDVVSESVTVSSGSTTTIVGIATTYRAAKILVAISDNNKQCEFDELTIIHDGTNVELLEYGQLTSNPSDAFSTSGLGTYYPYISGSNVNIDFIPNVGVAATVNTSQVLFGSNNIVGVGTYEMKHAILSGRSVSIASSTAPTPTIIHESLNVYDVGYAIVQVSDNTNNTHQISEIIFADDDNELYLTEYAILNTSSGLGTIGIQTSSGFNALTFTPKPNIDVNVKVYLNSLRYQDDTRSIVSFLGSEVRTNYGTYEGTDSDIRRSFNLTHKNQPIFERSFDGNDSLIVDINSNVVRIPNHFFVSGELVTYNNGGSDSTYSIGIAATSFVGIGITDRLPNQVYIVKVDNNSIKFARSAEDALSTVPKTLDIIGVGAATTHKIISTNQNAKVIVAIDNLIQSPIVSTALTTTLANNAFTTDDLIYFSDTTSFFGGDLIKIGNEIMRIEGVGIGVSNAVRVRRPLLGTVIAGYSTGSLITKVDGDYNIVDNSLNFADAPYGNIPLSTTTNPPNERDWIGISTSSKFQGRVFLRSGTPNSSDETYSKNYVFDSISSQFNGTKKTFTLKSNGSNVSGISNQNAVILINDIFQGPGLTYDYNLSESTGITSITFTGTATSVSYDVNNASIPRGGVIVSVGSSEGFGYQPLVSAGGTAIVSAAGTITSISIGNSGSGYRQGVQIVNVGIATSSTGTPNIEFIGTAVVSGGHVVSVAITNPGIGYTASNPPYVVFDDPLSYSNIPLVYSSSSSGVGTQATINIVVGQGSSVIDFEIVNTGYGYGEGETLTVPIGGITGIPTTGVSFSEFQISIQKTLDDEFTGWSIGELQVLDNLDDKFNGETSSFPLTLSNNLISIRSSKGSNINVQDLLLVFINDILQEPGKGYIFSGGSVIRFTEPPQVGDTSKILFYKGSGSIDVVDVNVLETVKIGDELTINYDPSLLQPPSLQEEERTVTSVNATDIVSTNPYFGPGNINDEALERPVTWCRQTEDKIINEKEVAKDREIYEPSINPFAYIIKPVSVGSTIIYVDNLKPFFDPTNENNTSLTFQKNVKIISQESKVGASATAVVSDDGTISSIVINDGGNGYTNVPTVTVGTPIGIGTQATATAEISNGRVTNISLNNAGTGYTTSNPPMVLISTPVPITEKNTVASYSGDHGIIVGFGTTTQSSIDKVIFDFYIPEDSFLRNSSLVGAAITLSSINVDDYFIVYDSNVGSAVTAVSSLNNSYDVIGIGTRFADNVYQVDSITVTKSNIIGIGTTYVKRVYSKIIGVGGTIDFSSTLITFDSNFYKFDYLKSLGSGFTGTVGINTIKSYGNFSWGKIVLVGRNEENQFNFYGDNGISGITSSAIVQRTEPLKFRNYIV